MREKIIFIGLLFFVVLPVALASLRLSHSTANSGVGILSIVSSSSLTPTTVYEFQNLSYTLQVVNTPSGVDDNPICTVKFYVKNATITLIPPKQNWATYYNSSFSPEIEEIIWNTTSDCIPLGGNSTFNFYAKADEVEADYISSWVLSTPDILDKKSFNVTILNDSLAPRILSYNPEDGGFIKNGTNESFSVSFNESESGIKEGNLFYENAAGCSPTTINNNLSMLCSSDNCTTSSYVERIYKSGIWYNYLHFYFELKDNAGNTNHTNIPLVAYIDNEAPMISLSEPPNKSIKNYTLVEFNFTIDDNSFLANEGAGCSGKFDPKLYCNLIINGVVKNGSVYNSNGTYALKANLSDGIHNWLVSCSDKADWQNSSETRILVIDTTPPTIILEEPLNSSHNQENVTLKWNVTDNLDSNLTCYLNVDGTSYLFYGTGEMEKNLTLNEGKHFWNVSCYDWANNSNTSETRIFIVDKTAPSVTLKRPSNNTVFSSLNYSLLNFSCVASDNFASTINITLYISQPINTTQINNNSEANFSNPGLDDGTFNWSCLACDLASNCAFAENFTFTIERGPSIKIIYPKNKTYYTNTEPKWQNKVNVSFQDFDFTKFNITGALANINGTNYTLSRDGSYWYNDSLNLQEGNYELKVYVNDSLGNTNSTSVTFAVTHITSTKTGGGGGGGTATYTCGNNICERDLGENENNCPNDCVNCTELWICTEWGRCINGEQLRSCYDANHCGTEEEKPETRRVCRTKKEEKQKKEKEKQEEEQEETITAPLTGGVVGTLRGVFKRAWLPISIFSALLALAYFFLLRRKL